MVATGQRLLAVGKVTNRQLAHVRISRGGTEDVYKLAPVKQLARRQSQSKRTEGIVRHGYG